MPLSEASKAALRAELAELRDLVNEGLLPSASLQSAAAVLVARYLGGSEAAAAAGASKTHHPPGVPWVPNVPEGLSSMRVD